jgi:threonine synthase
MRQLMNTLAESGFQWKCYGCGSAAPLDGAYTCACGEPYAVEFCGDSGKDLFSLPPQSMWQYGPLLPVVDAGARTTLGEGATPLIAAAHLPAQFDVREVLLKNEAGNPTGSFKDRQIAVGISHARELGLDTVAVVSSGNVACAASAYAARAGMRAIVFTHSHAALSKVKQAMAYGARVLRVDSPSAAGVFELCREACRRFGWYHLSTAGMYEPFNVEGAKTIAYEIYQQTGGDLPDWIVAPVGGGGLLGALWRGFLDLRRLGLIQHIPRLAGVQAAGCAPLVEAIRDHTSFLDTLRRPWPDPHTVAGGIADDILFDGHTVLPAIRETHGVAVAVTDEQILDAELLLARHEGLLAEPSSAVVVAALASLPDRAGARVCCVITGSGIKDLDVLQDRLPVAAVIAPTMDAVAQRLQDTD